MNDAMSADFSVPETILQPLFTASNSSTLDKALKSLTDTARVTSGRSDLASINILIPVLHLLQSLPYPSGRCPLFLSLKLVRNLCAGEIANQTSFIEQNGVGIISAIFSAVRIASDSDHAIIRMGLQVLGNVSLAGEEHQRAIWSQFFSFAFVNIARVQSRDTCDPLCMVIYTCCIGNNGLIAELSTDEGLGVVLEITRTASAVGFAEDWLKLLLSKICLEESLFAPLFSKLSTVDASENYGAVSPSVDLFVPEQAFLLSVLSEILNEQIRGVTVLNDFALCVLRILRSAAGDLDSLSRSNSGLPTGSTDIDVLGYSLTILRDICACDGVETKAGSVNVVDLLVSSGLIELLLSLLRDLEAPTIIRKAMKQGENQEGTTSDSSKVCPYKGFRRDVVAVIGNCAYRRKHVQNEIREKNGILLLLQQCVTDDDNPFLREWGIWSVRNLLETNAENQRLVSELELQGSVDVPELSGLGLRVEVDQKTRRAKLVNVS